MDNAHGVSCCQGLRRLDTHLQRFIQSHSIAGNQPIERLSLHVLHGNEVNSSCFIDIVNGLS